MSRNLKQRLLKLLSQENFEEELENICQEFPERQVVNPLFSFFYSTDELIKWRAVTATGTVVKRIAAKDMESARVIMRRLMWNLNDESGGIGWGSPEAMGEIMARENQLAKEYHSILISYIREDGNYIEHEILQRGVLWGLGRLASVRPELVKDAAPFLIPFLKSEDPMLRGLAAWVAKAVKAEETKAQLEDLRKDNTKITIFLDGNLIESTVSQIGSFHSLRLEPTC